jgi:hypothetical protein
VIKYFGRVCLAAASLFLAATPHPLSAQSSPIEGTQTASLSLPDAPTPRNQTPATQAPATTPPSSSTQPATSAPADAKSQHDQAEHDIQTQEKQRLLGIMPQFQVVMGGKAVPLTAGEKWRLALHSAKDPFYIGYAFVIGGGYGELVDSNTGYGHGPAGYFKRVGSNYADNVDGALIGNALLPAILHQDPRYFRKGTGGFRKRFVYAALSTVICHGDNGKNQFNTSNVLGNYIAGAISNAYYPADQRGVGQTLETGTSVTLFGALGGQLLEFGPDISKYLNRHKKTTVASPPLATHATSAP